MAAGAVGQTAQLSLWNILQRISAWKYGLAEANLCAAESNLAFVGDGRAIHRGSLRIGGIFDAFVSGSSRVRRTFACDCLLQAVLAQ